MILRIPNPVPGEKIVVLLRRHWLVLFGKLLFWLLVALGPVVVAIIVNGGGTILPDTEGMRAFNVLFISIYYLYVWLFAFHSFVDYYLDVWIVTTERVIDIELKGLFSRTVSEQKLFRVQDVTAEHKGFFSTFFDFGNVFVQTAGETARFTFKQIPMPTGVARKVIDTVEACKHQHNHPGGSSN